MFMSPDSGVFDATSSFGPEAAAALLMSDESSGTATPKESNANCLANTTFSLGE